MRTRVLRDQLGAKLAKEAQADFDAPLIAREAPAPAEPGADERRARRARPAEERSRSHRPDRNGQRGRGEERERRFDPEAAARRPPPAQSTPERRRKHVSRLRAEIAADAAATRKRIERSATHDRKGRTIAVERISPTREEARRRAAAETRRPGAGDRKAGKRGPQGRERSPRSENAHGGGRAEFRPRGESAGKREGGSRERAFDRPQGRKPERSGESRPPRADARDRGAALRIQAARRKRGEARGRLARARLRPAARPEAGAQRREPAAARGREGPRTAPGIQAARNAH